MRVNLDRNECLLNVFYEVNISGIRNDTPPSWERIEKRLEIRDANRKGMINLRDEGEERGDVWIRIKKCLIDITYRRLWSMVFFFFCDVGLMMDIFLSEIFFFMRFKYLSRVLSNIITRNIVDNIAWNIIIRHGE